MSNQKKWSEQTLVKQSFKVHENGQEIIKEIETLDVCISGKELYRKEFALGKFKDKDELAIPFDFIVLAGTPCPEGRFYELDYFIGERGLVYRALIQAVNPVTDIPLIVGALRRKNILQKEFNPWKAFLRDDIERVCVGHCSRDVDGVAAFSSGINEANDSDQSILDACSVHDVCLEYYRGDLHEVWAGAGDTKDLEKIFVCGSENVDDPAFADQRKEDMYELQGHLDEAEATIRDYSLKHIIVVENGVTEDGKTTFRCSFSNDLRIVKGICEAIFQRIEQFEDVEECDLESEENKE